MKDDRNLNRAEQKRLAALFDGELEAPLACELERRLKEEGRGPVCAEWNWLSALRSEYSNWHSEQSADVERAVASQRIWSNIVDRLEPYEKSSWSKSFSGALLRFGLNIRQELGQDLLVFRGLRVRSGLALVASVTLLTLSISFMSQSPFQAEQTEVASTKMLDPRPVPSSAFEYRGAELARVSADRDRTDSLNRQLSFRHPVSAFYESSADDARIIDKQREFAVTGYIRRSEPVVDIEWIRSTRPIKFVRAFGSSSPVIWVSQR